MRDTSTASEEVKVEEVPAEEAVEIVETVEKETIEEVYTSTSTKRD